MALILLLVFIMASYVCVRIGAIMLELTGIPWERAKFQALSAFSTTGFTTPNESSDVVRHPIRRKIISTLIIVGNAGIVTTIGSFAGSIVGTDVRSALINLGVAALFIVVLAWVAKRRFIARPLRFVLQRWLANRYDFTPTTEAMLHFDQGYCMNRVCVPAGSPVVGRCLRDLQLMQNKIQVLAIERGKTFIPVPTGNDELEAGDTVVIYGTEENMDAIFEPDGHQRMSVVLEPGAPVVLSEGAKTRRGSQLHAPAK